MATLNAGTFSRLSDAEAHYLLAIDVAAAKARYADPTQLDLYRIKLAEAQAGGGQLLDAEASATGATKESVRDSVLRQHELRRRRINAIEVERIKAKQAIRESSTSAEMHAAKKSFLNQL